MPKSYNQFRGMLAITKASLRAMLRSPSAILFSIFFPLIFILVFGFLGNSGGPVYKIVVDSTGVHSNVLTDSLLRYSNVRIIKDKTPSEIESDLLKGRITGVLRMERGVAAKGDSLWIVHFRSTTASADRFATFLPFLENIISKIDRASFPDRPTVARVVPEIEVVREYRTIDFILPGQLGFSLLSAGVFGVAFLFFNLRQQLVLKRFFATPINKSAIVVGEGLSRVIFQLMTAVIIIVIGHFVFKFTLVNGWITFIEIMVLSFIALLVFMGFGFIVSGLAKNESTIPPFANLFTLPQFLLAGTFFSIEAFPTWLQPLCKILPLTYFNDAMRKIAFEGAHLTDCGQQIAILLAWGVVVYVIAVRVFKWE